MLRAIITTLLTLVFSGLAVAAEGHKAGDAKIEPFMDTFGYLPREVAKSEMERGEQVYVQWCAICHRDGTGMAGTYVLKTRYKGALPAILEERADLSGPLIETYVRRGMGSMPYFRKTEVSDADLEALIVYLTTKDK